MMRSWTRENIGLLERLATKGALRLRLERAVAVDRLLRKYSPNQPRIPAGNSGGGQWTGEGGANGAAPNNNSVQLAAQSVQFCNNQLIIDNLKCNSVQPAWYRAACRSQAMERYAACLTGRPLPPLPFFGD